MLKIFRTNHLVSGFLLIFYAALIRSVVFILHPIETIPDNGGVLSQLLYQFTQTNGWIPDLLSLGIIFINALIINYLVAQNFLAQEINLFPGLFYIIVASCVPDFLGLSALHLANTFLIIGCFSIFEIYNKPSPAKYIFNAGLLIGVSTLFNLSYGVFFVWVLIAINTLQTLKLKNFFMAFSGFALPWIYTFLYYYWNGILGVLVENHLQNQLHFFAFDTGKTFFDFIPMIILVLLLIVVLTGYNNHLLKKKFEIKKKISLIYWMIFFGLLFLMTGTAPLPEQLIVFTVPVGILLSLSFTKMAPPFDGLYHILLLFIVILMHYLTLLGVI